MNMPLSFTVHENAAYLHCETSGPASLADMRAAVDLLRSLAANRSHKRVLVDMRQVQHALSFTEHLQLGAYVAETLHHMEKVASVVLPQRKVGVTAQAAQKLGTSLRTFDVLGEAQEWLCA